MFSDFLMDDRYERAGTIGFRCAADVPAAESARPCVPGGSGSKACGTFDAPAAFTDLTAPGVTDWVAFGLGAAPPVDPEGAVSCYRRMDVVIAKCDENSPWSTWVLSGRGSTGTWAEHKGANCFTCARNCNERFDHGGKTVPGREPYSKSISLEGCQAACSSDANCTAIVTGAAKVDDTAAIVASENSTARMKGGSGELPSAVAGLAGSAVTNCPQLVAIKPSVPAVGVHSPLVAKAGVVSFSWSDGTGTATAANLSTGVCSPTGLRFTMPLTALDTTVAKVLSLWAGVSAGTLIVNASFAGGAAIYAEELAATPSDVSNAILRSNRWDIHLPAGAFQSAGDLTIDLAVTVPPPPPPQPPAPPPAPLPPCVTALCLDEASCSAHKCTDVDLNAVGDLDWLHWMPEGHAGSEPATKKGAGLIQCLCAKGAVCPCSKGSVKTYNPNPTTFSWKDGELG